MQLTCLKEDLQKAVSLMNRITGMKSGFNFLGKIFLQAKSNQFIIKTTNLEISLTAEIPSKIEREGTLLVPARLLADFLNLADQEKLDLVVEGNHFLVKTANSSAKINFEEAKDYPQFPKISEPPFFSLSKELFIQMAKKTCFSVAQDLSRPVLGGVLLKNQKERLVAVGTDGFRLSEFFMPSLSVVTSFERVIVPAKTVLEMAYLLETQKTENDLLDFYLTQDKNQLAVKIGSVELMSRLLEAEYPDYEKIIPQESSTEAILEKAQFIKLIKTVSLFSPKEGQMIKVEIGENGNVKVLAESQETGQGEAEITGEVKGTGVLLAFNSRFLLDGLNSLDEEKARFLIKDKFAPVILSGEGNKNYRYLIMPIRLS